ncbi:MAG: hypothetical protein L3J62_10035 [Gammaproteobacteria bacterium]|nr:hypothetical protein [Gammaproteobacteria bacterium]
MVFDAIPTPQSKKNKSEPAEVFSDPKALRKTISKTPINLPTTFSAASDKLPAPLESKIKEKVEARAEAEVKVKPKKAIENQISDPWQSVTSRIWFVSGLHVLGPKSTAKLLDVIDQLHPLKTIWLDGRLLPSELTRLSPDQAKLLMVSRALSVRKALQKAGVKTEIRIKHPKLVAEGRYVSLEQGR